MKTFTIYASLALVSMASAQEACVEGKRVTINPGYTVEYRCNKYRAGQRYNSVLTHEDCAAKCQTEGRDVCTYNAAKKMCIVGDPDGKEGVSNGATYMIKVEEEEEDPFKDDPFPETCEEDRDSLKEQLDKCHADLEAASKKTPSPTTPPSCGVAKWGQGWYKINGGMTLANCKIACNADPKCLSYSANSGNTGSINCYLYDKETANVPHGTWANWVQYDKRCG